MHLATSQWYPAHEPSVQSKEEEVNHQVDKSVLVCRPWDLHWSRRWQRLKTVPALYYVILNDEAVVHILGIISLAHFLNNRRCSVQSRSCWKLRPPSEGMPTDKLQIILVSPCLCQQCTNDVLKCLHSILFGAKSTLEKEYNLAVLAPIIAPKTPQGSGGIVRYFVLMSVIGLEYSNKARSRRTHS